MIKLNKDVLWLIRGAQRKLVFLNLPKNPFMPNKLRKDLNEKLPVKLSLREMSRHLRDFEKRGLIKCLNSSDPYNRVYSISDKGLKVKNELGKSGL